MSEGFFMEPIKEWIKKYTEALIDELKPNGEVLEVGFGAGFASERIQHFHPKQHTIIEADPAIAERAKKWAASRQNVKIVQEEWGKALTGLGEFDQVFYNEISGSLEKLTASRPRHEQAAKVLSQAKETIKNLEAELSRVQIAFTDKDIDDFFQKFGRFNLKELPSFFRSLKEKKHITEAQYQKALKQYKLTEGKETEKPSPLPISPSQETLFLEKCIERHMRKGGRFSCFLPDPLSKYEDPYFFDRIITNPKLSYHEKSMAFNVPGSDLREGIIMLVVKQ
jgi:hypothetical protein